MNASHPTAPREYSPQRRSKNSLTETDTLVYRYSEILDYHNVDSQNGENGENGEKNA